MKKNLKFIPILALIIPAFSIFAPANAIFTNKICAADVVKSGNECVGNVGNCANLPGYTLVSKANFTTSGLGKQDLITAIDGTYGANADNKLCISNSLKTVIKTYGYKYDPEIGATQLSALTTREVLFADDISTFARVCPPDWGARTAPNTINSWSKPIGCCPPGYDFVNPKGEESILDMQQGVCVQSGLKATSIKISFITYPLDPGSNQAQIEAMDSAGNVVSTLPWMTVGQGQFSDFQSLKSAIGTAPILYSYKNGFGKVSNPQLGYGLGPSLLDADIPGEPVGKKIATGTPYTGSDFVCPNNSQCAIDANGGLNDVKSSGDYANTPGLKCGKCFTNGDVIGTSTAASGTADNPATPNVDESVGFVRYCDSTAADPSKPYRDETLIGTPDITSGYLLEDSTNKALYKQCFDTGGIYTAIGCIDPTPTGIITGLIRIALGVMGGVALLQLIYVGILYQQGNTEKIKGARTQLIATITGIAVLVFSVLILRIIGVNILDVVSNGSV